MIFEKYKQIPKNYTYKFKQENKYSSYYAIIFFLIILDLFIILGFWNQSKLVLIFSLIGLAVLLYYFVKYYKESIRHQIINKDSILYQFANIMILLYDYYSNPIDKNQIEESIKRFKYLDMPLRFNSGNTLLMNRGYNFDSNNKKFCNLLLLIIKK